MSEMSNEAIQAQISARGLKVGNAVHIRTAQTPVAANTMLTTDANSFLQATPDCPVVQPTITGQLFTLTGGSTSGVLTTTLVAGSDVTTVTKGAFLRVNLTDSNGNITNGNYYIQLSTLT